MKLYTKTGDDGSTGLLSGPRVLKDHPRVTAYGEVDELNAMIGWAACAPAEGAELAACLVRVQSDLFSMGAELADPKGRSDLAVLSDQDVRRLEGWIDESCARTTPLKSFILPGGSEAASRLHIARTVCRRAERACVHLSADVRLRPVLIRYLNRLSDLLFAWAREANAVRGVADVPWTPAAGSSEGASPGGGYK